MSTTSKSPKAILMTAHAVAAGALPAYSHPSSPRKFTQHQLFACLVLRAAMKLDYRGLQALLVDCSDLRGCIGLKAVPHWTAFQKTAARLMSDAAASGLLDVTAAGGTPGPAPTAAIDSTGLATGHASAYSTRRRREGGGDGPRTKYHAFPKLGIACCAATHPILAGRHGLGPSPDVTEFEPLLRAALARRGATSASADAGYDSEANHRLAREGLGVATLIPAKRGRPSSRPPTGRYRAEMAGDLVARGYGQRWQVEAVMSMIKRRQGEAVWSRGEAGWMRDMRIMVLAHNIMIYWSVQPFLQSRMSPFFLLDGRS